MLRLYNRHVRISLLENIGPPYELSTLLKTSGPQFSLYKRNQATTKGDRLIRLAFRTGIEPATCGLGNRCSVLLSYRNRFHSEAKFGALDAEFLRKSNHFVSNALALLLERENQPT